MSTFRTYPEIVRLDKRPEILSVTHVVATEKVHGTNFRVFFPVYRRMLIARVSS